MKPPRRMMDHPRSRGVYLAVARTPPRPAGSSPLARGLLEVRATIPRDPGIIPARAGFTDGPSCATSDRTDHPRSRGVYSMAAEGGLNYLAK